MSWPGGQRLAVTLILHLEHFEPATATEHSEYSRREYGLRTGLFRMLPSLDALGLRVTVAMDAHTAAHKPFLVDVCRERGWEIAAHGLVGNQMISSTMSPEDERSYIIRTLDLMERHAKTRPIGWLGPEFGESPFTPAILADCGVKYLCDWPNDEQPYKMTTPTGQLTALPIALELDDFFALEQRKLSTERWSRSVREAAKQLIEDGAVNARTLVLSLRPWIMGQPHRIEQFATALDWAMDSRVWLATAAEIVQASRDAQSASQGKAMDAIS